MNKHLILGGAGFIGGKLTRALVAKGERPKVFTRPNSSISNLEDILDQIDIVYGDFREDVELCKVLKGIDTVFHLISSIGPRRSLESSLYDVESNLVPTIHLVENCLANGVRKIVFASSGGTIYGEPEITPIPEDHPLLPKSIYGQSKLTIENLLNFYARSTGLEVNILRISNPFGPGQNPSKPQGIVAVAMDCAYYERVLKIYGKGEAVRDYIYIDDVAEAMLLVAESSGSSIVNISSGIGQSVMDIVQAIEEISGWTIRKEFVPNCSSDVKANILDKKRIYDVYGWYPKVEFKDGLTRTLAQYTRQINLNSSYLDLSGIRGTSIRTHDRKVYCS